MLTAEADGSLEEGDGDVDDNRPKKTGMPFRVAYNTLRAQLHQTSSQHLGELPRDVPAFTPLFSTRTN